MPQVGRPRSRTQTGAPAPVQELGVPDTTYGMGSSINVLSGKIRPWSLFVDQHEFVPELAWPNSIRTYDKMRTDSQVAALYTAVAYGISQLRFIVNPNGAKEEIVKGISEDLNLPIRGQDDEPRRRLKRRFSHGRLVSQALLSLIYGHMFFEQLGTIENGLWRLRKLAPRMPQSIQYINVADDGGLVSIQQYRPGNRYATEPPPEIPVDRLVCFPFGMEGANWTGRSMLRDIYKDWLIKDRLVRIDAINHERAGGVPYIEAASGATPGEISDLDEMARKFRIGESSGGAIPFGSKLQIARGTGSDVDKSIHSRDEAMARRFLLQLMNLAQSGQHVGSYSLGETFEDFFIVGQRHIVQWYCDVVTEHIIEDWVDWNYDDEDLTPQITWERTSEDALGVEQLSTLVQRGVIAVDDELENAIRYKYRLPKRTTPRPEVTPGGPRQPNEQQALNQTPAGDAKPKTGAGSGKDAPSSSKPAPAPVKASHAPFDWERDPEFGTPHVMAAGKPSIVTVPNVPILEAGVEYQISTGKTTFTPEDLADAVCAANEDPSIPSPRLKIGHIDPRFNGAQYDGTPAFGTAKNLRLSDNGMAIYADYQGVPKWLADIMPAAFPNRSIEGFWDVESNTGNRWSFVLSACALLGVQWPGITQLEDLPNYYGEEKPPDVIIAASQPGGDPMTVLASANLDDVRRAFYQEYVPNADNGARYWWVRAVLVDPNQLVVEDDESGQLYTLPFEADDEGSVSFGESEAVRVDYVSDKKAAASHVAAALAVGREVLATYESRAASRPEEGGNVDPKEIRKRLGLPEDASDEQVQSSIREINEAAGLKLAEAAPTNQTQNGVTAVGTGTAEELEQAAQVGRDNPDTPITPSASEGAQTAVEDARQRAAAEAAAASGKDEPDNVVHLDRKTFDELKAGAQAGLGLKQENDKRSREALVEAAIGDGRVPPARRQHWLDALEADHEGNAPVLASLSPGLVPLEQRGAESGEAQVAAEAENVQGWTHQLFPETRARAERAAAAASGQRPLVMREEGH